MLDGVEESFLAPVHAVIPGKGHDVESRIPQCCCHLGSTPHRVARLWKAAAALCEVYFELAECNIRLAQAIAYQGEAVAGIGTIRRYVTDRI
jgi:hypothetical protein